MAKTKRRPVSKRTRAAHLPGMEPPRIAEIDTAAERYFDAKSERMELTKKEVEYKEDLKRAMKEHGQTHYVTPDDLECSLGVSEEVSCKRKKADVTVNGEE